MSEWAEAFEESPLEPAGTNRFSLPPEDRRGSGYAAGHATCSGTVSRPALRSRRGLGFTFGKRMFAGLGIPRRGRTDGFPVPSSQRIFAESRKSRAGCRSVSPRPFLYKPSTLIAVVEPLRQELFRRLNTAPGGTTALVSMRRHILRQLGAHPQWASVEADLEHLLTSWFNRGFLSLRKIDWRTPAIVLEKLIQYEAVHEIQGWRDLRRRLRSGPPLLCILSSSPRGRTDHLRRCRSHARNERQGVPIAGRRFSGLDIQSANCAMFYSITNCQDGLRGIPFGNFLIKQVVQDLGEELRQIRTFATVSPVPSFRAWLEETARTEKGTTGQKLADLNSRGLDEPDWMKDKKTSEFLKAED